MWSSLPSARIRGRRQASRLRGQPQHPRRARAAGSTASRPATRRRRLRARRLRPPRRHVADQRGARHRPASPRATLDTLALLDWGFDNFRLVTPVAAGAAVASRPVQDRRGRARTLIADRARSSGVLPRSARVTTVVRAPRELRRAAAPRAWSRHAILVTDGAGARSHAIPLRLARGVPAPPASLSPTTIARDRLRLSCSCCCSASRSSAVRRERLTGRRAASQQQE